MKKQKTKAELRELYTDEYVRNFENNEHSQSKRIQGVIKNVDFAKTDVIGDFACGNGLLSYFVHDKVKECYGVDFSKEFINVAKLTAEKNNIKNVVFCEASIIDFCEENPTFFDKIFTLDFSEHIYDDDFNKIYSNIYSALKKNGQLILHTPNGDFFVEIFKKIGIMKQFPEHIAVRNSKQYFNMLSNIGFKNISVTFIPHYNILKYFHFFSFMPFIGKFFEARILIICTK